MKQYICNAFSLQMLSEANAEISIKEVNPTTIEASEYYWALGHADTSKVVSAELGIEDPGANRVNIKLEKGDELVVAQLVGGRLPEGASSLPKGFSIEFYSVIIKGAK